MLHDWKDERVGQSVALLLKNAFACDLHHLKMDDPKSPGQQATDIINDYANYVVLTPVRLSLGLVKKIQPYAPQLAAVAIVILFVPVLITLSSYAGYFVWKSVAVGWDVPLYLQYGCVVLYHRPALIDGFCTSSDGVPPWAEAELPRLVPKQRYDFSLHLALPVTPSNFALGNFMTTLTLSTPSNTTIASIRRPVRDL